MAQKSIVDRVLMLAAGICAAALVWQLTVLLTSKGRTSQSSGPVAAVVSTPHSAEPPAAPVPSLTTTTPVRVVYAGTEAASKTSVKASDPPSATIADAGPAPQRTLAAPTEDAAPAPAASVSDARSTEARSTDTSSVGPLALVTSPSPDFAAMPDTDADRTASTPPPASPPARVAVAKPEPPAIEDSAPAAAPSAGGGIDLNRASVDALNRLKGAGHIGQAIVSHRPYRSVEDLVKKRVLRRDVYEQIKQQVVTQ